MRGVTRKLEQLQNYSTMFLVTSQARSYLQVLSFVCWKLELLLLFFFFFNLDNLQVNLLMKDIESYSEAIAFDSQA